MGADFMSKAGRSIERALDRSLRDLGTPDLFRRKPDRAERTVAAAVVPGESIGEGERLVVRRQRDDIVAQRGIKTVARVVNPGPELSAALAQTTARSGEVRKVLPLSNTIELKVD